MILSIGPVKRVLRIHYESRDKRSLLFDYYTTYRTDVSLSKSLYMASMREASSFPCRSFLSCNVLIIHLYASRVLTCMICDNEQMSSLSTGLFFFLIVHLHNMLIRKNEFVFLDDFKIY